MLHGSGIQTIWQVIGGTETNLPPLQFEIAVTSVCSFFFFSVIAINNLPGTFALGDALGVLLLFLTFSGPVADREF